MTWQDRAKAKRDAVLALIPEEWRIENPPNDQQVDVTGPFIQQYLSVREIEITETPAERIVERTTSGQWKAEEVARAFCHRAALAHQLTNCLHEIFFTAALADAKALDAHLATHGKPTGPLHGLPISLKDQFHVRDVETSMGYTGWLNTFEGLAAANSTKYKTHESEIVRELRAAGAILYVKTSVPHTLMTGETVNNIIGYTWNPKNRHLSSGGSSGGEGALMGLRGSPVGFGTDIGGSVRIPAAFNGVFGLRPSTGRLPYEGSANSMDGQNSVLSVVGPLGTSVGALRLVVKAVLGQRPWVVDPMVVELPWRGEQEDVFGLNEGESGGLGKTKKLAFGVLRSDGIVNPQPPIKRAIDIVVSKLRELGHEVIEWTPPSHATLLGEGMKICVFDAGADVKKAFALSGEPMAEQVAYLTQVDREFTASELAATNVRIRQLRKEYMDYWNSTEALTSTGRPVDAVIAPVAPFPAARPNMYHHVGYSAFVNILDYTSVVVPVTEVDKSIDRVEEGYEALNEMDQKVHDEYDPEIFHGAHVSLQLMGRRLQEEKMLAIAEYVGNALGK